MSKNQLILNNTIILYIRLLFILFISLYSTRVLLKNLGVEDFGLFGTVAGVIALISFLQSALSNAVNRFFNIEMVGCDVLYFKKIFSTSVFLHIVISLFLVLLIEVVGIWVLNSYVSLPPGKTNISIFIFHFSVISLFFLVVTIPFEALLITKEKFGVYALISIFDVGLKLILASVLVFFGDNRLLYYAVGFSFIVFLVRVFYVVYVSLKFDESKIVFCIERNFLNKIISFISWDLYGNFSVVFKVHGITLLVNNFFGLVGVASIQIGNQVSAALHSLSSNLLIAVKPQLMRSYAENDFNRTNELIIYSSKYAYYLMLVFCVPFISHIDYILRLWLVNPPEYAAVITIFMLITSLIGVVFNPIIMLIHATGNVRKISFLTGSLILISVPIVYILFNWGYNYYYAYIVLALNSVFIGFLNLWIAKKLVESFNVYLFFKKVLVSLTSTSFVIYLFVYFLDKFFVVSSVLSFIAISISQVLIIMLLIYFLGIEKRHKDVINKKLTIIFKQWAERL